MSVPADSLTYHRIRAPREHGQALIVPPLDEVGTLLVDNRQRLAAATSPLSSQLAAWRTQARSDLVQAALHYTAQYRDVPATSSSHATPLLLSGHQPQLFHAGVWFKNFVLSSLAQRHQAIGINLVVDNDTLRAASIRVPSGSPNAPLVENVPLDTPGEEIPFEERAIHDDSLFRSFAERVTATIKPWIANPLVRDLWPLAMNSLGRTRKLGEVLANARHKLEAAWGQQTLEVPLSTIYSQASFRRFSLRLLQDLPKFSDVYNQALAEYRRVNHVRSRSHPVPDLAVDDTWHEAPLWIWSTSHPHRKRLFVRHTSSGLELTDRERIQELLPLGTDNALEAWSAIEQHGIKIRPRALMTTMFARLVLSDLFLHGIGGAKYDELTDAILRRYFGVEPPTYLTVTATVQLPLQFERVSRDEVLLAQHELRALRYHPERFAVGNGTDELVTRKVELLQNIPPRGEKKAWHREVAALNESLQPSVEREREQLEARIAELTERHRRTRLLGSREFSFCLFPADFLRAALMSLAASPQPSPNS
jgi:hypothetical protein